MRIGAAVLLLGLMISTVVAAQPISGSDWSLTVQREGGQVISCGVLKFTGGAEVRLAIGSQGSLALIVRDPMLQNQLADVGLWKAGMIYSAQVFIGSGKPLSLEGQQVGAQSILVRLPYAAGEALKKVSRVAIGLNGLAMRGYDVSGIGRGYVALIECAKGSGLVADQVLAPTASPSTAKAAPDAQPSSAPLPPKRANAPAKKPAQPDVRSKIAQYAVVPIQGCGWTKTIQEWGDDWIRRINLAMPRVAEHVAKSPTCDLVESVGISSRSTPRQNAVFYVDCRNKERFYVAEAELGGAAPTSKNSQTARISDDSAIAACVDQVTEQLTVPLSFERHRLSTKVYRSPYGNIAVDFNFNAKNQMGGSIPQHARCVIDDTGIHPAEISAQ